MGNSNKLNRLLLFLRKPRIPWFILERMRRISPRLYKRLRYGSANPNTDEYWSARYAAEEIKTDGFYREFYRALEPLVPGNSLILDAGCGTGRLLTMFRDRKNCRGVGLDISRRAIRIVREKGLAGYVAALPAMPEEVAAAAPFDVCMMNEVLEHVDDPVAVVAAVTAAAMPRRLLITVPHDSLKPHEHDEHIHSFTMATIGSVMNGTAGYACSRSIITFGNEEYILLDAVRGGSGS